MKNATQRVGLEPTTFVTLSADHRASHLRLGGWRTKENWLGWSRMQLNYCSCVIVCDGFGWLVGLSSSDIC